MVCPIGDMFGSDTVLYLCAMLFCIRPSVGES